MAFLEELDYQDLLEEKDLLHQKDKKERVVLNLEDQDLLVLLA